MLGPTRAISACFFVAAIGSSTGATLAANEQHWLCQNIKYPMTSWDSSAVACYSDRACAYVLKKGGDPLPDYDVKSVSAALGRGKIEALLTTSASIVSAGKKYDYSCSKITLD